MRRDNFLVIGSFFTANHRAVFFGFPRKLPCKLLQTALQGVVVLCLDHPVHFFLK
jgi:hypothetical protein